MYTDMIYKFLLVFLPLVLLQVNYGLAIECYSCRSDTEPNCESGELGPQFLMNCSTLKTGPKYTACRKMVNWVDFKVLEQKPIHRVIRQCAADVERDRPCYYRAGFGGRANVCDCFEDRCNSAALPISSLVVTIIAFIFVFKIFS